MSQTLVLRVTMGDETRAVMDHFAEACARWSTQCFGRLYAGKRNGGAAKEVFWRDQAGERSARWRIDRTAAYRHFVAGRPIRTDIRLAKALQGLLTKVDVTWQNFNNPKLPNPRGRLPQFRASAHFANQMARLKLKEGQYTLTLPNPIEQGTIDVSIVGGKSRDYQQRVERLVQDLARRGAKNTPSMEFIRHADGAYYVHVPIEAPRREARGNATAGVDAGIINTAGFAIVHEDGAQETLRVSAGAMRHRFERLHARRRQLRRRTDRKAARARRCRQCRGSGREVKADVPCRTCGAKGYRKRQAGRPATSPGKWWPQNRNAQRAHARLKGQIARTNTTVAHQISRALVDECSRKGVALVGLEDLRQLPPPRGQRQYNRQATQWNRGEFRDSLAYKAEWAGMQTKEVEARDTTVRCSRCAHRQRGNIPDTRARHFKCLRCGFEGDRDENAAVNIAQRAYRLANKRCLDCGSDGAEYAHAKYRCDDCAHRFSLSKPASKRAAKDSRRGGRKAGPPGRRRRGNSKPPVREGSSPDEGDGSEPLASGARARRKTPTIGAAGIGGASRRTPARTSRATTTLDVSTETTCPKVEQPQQPNEQRGGARAPQEPSRASGQDDDAAGSRPDGRRRRTARRPSGAGI